MEIAQTPQSSPAPQILLVLTTLPDLAHAQGLAEILLQQRLAACINILSSCVSVYRWQGKVEQAHEVPVAIKTTVEGYAALEAAIRRHHPYELPEIIAVPVVHGLPAYLAWVATETTSIDGISTSC